MKRIYFAIIFALFGMLLPCTALAYNYDDEDEPGIDVTDDDWGSPGTIAVDVDETQTGIHPTAVAPAAPLTVTLSGKTVVVNTPVAAFLPVYTIEGRLAMMCNLLPGENRISLPDGLYIINRRKYKI